MKRAALVLCFVTAVAAVTSVAFVALNSEHAFQMARKAMAAGSKQAAADESKRGDAIKERSVGRSILYDNELRSTLI